MKVAYLFFNGQLRGSKKFYSNLIEKQEGDIYCADGGANIAYQLNLIPKEIYGDLDSIKDEVKDFYAKKNVKFIKFNVEKDYTDSELVLNEIEKKYDKIYAIAALGGSIDHELTNINLLNRYSNLIFVSQKEKMFKILEELYLNQDEWNKKVKDTMVKYFYDVLNDDFFDEIYSSHSIKRVDASRMINSNGAKRGKIKELLISNF